MNEYGFDYMNYINNVPDMNNMINKFNVSKLNNKMDVINEFNMNNSNKMIENYKIKKNNNNMYENDTLEPYEGFIRGNLFKNLYDPYKNYKPQKIDANNEREALLYQVMEYKFALIELNLYLDTNPNDREAIELFNKYQKLEKQMCKQYESMYGPLTIDSEYLNNSNWVWNNSPWPWEVM